MTPAANGLPAWIAAALLALAMPAAAQENPNTIVAQLVLKDDGSKIEVVRNPQARTLEMVTRGAAGEISRKDVFRLNPAGDPVACSIYDGAGKLIYRVNYVFDKMGRKIAEGTYNTRGKRVRRATFPYDANGKALTPKIENFPDAERMPTAPLAPELTPEGRVAQPPPAKR